MQNIAAASQQQTPKEMQNIVTTSAQLSNFIDTSFIARIKRSDKQNKIN